MPQNPLDGTALSGMPVKPDVLDTDRIAMLRPTEPDPADQNITVTYRRFAYALLPGVLASLGPTLALKADLDPGTHLVPANELPIPTFAALSGGPFSNPQLAAVLIPLLNSVDDGITAIDYADLATASLIPGRLYRVENRTDGSGLDVLAFAGTNNDLEGADAYTVPDGLDAPTLPVSYDQSTDTVGDRSTTLPPPIESQYQEVSRAGAVLLLAFGGVKPIRYRIHRADPATGYVDILGFAPDGDLAQDCRFSPLGFYYDPSSNTTTWVNYDVITDTPSAYLPDLSQVAFKNVAQTFTEQQTFDQGNGTPSAISDSGYTQADGAGNTGQYNNQQAQVADQYGNIGTLYSTGLHLNNAVLAPTADGMALNGPLDIPDNTTRATAAVNLETAQGLVAAEATARDAAIATATVNGVHWNGAYDASTSPGYPTVGSGTTGGVRKGDQWYISASGTVGGVAVTLGNLLVARIATPGQVAANWDILQANLFQAGPSTPGTVVLASNADAAAGTDTQKAMTPAAAASITTPLASTVAGHTTAIATNAAAIAKYDPTFAAVTASSGTATIAAASKFVVNVTLALSANTTLAFTGLVSGAVGTVLITHDSSTTTYTVTLPSGGVGTVTVGQTANAVTELSWLYNGSVMLWTSKSY